MRKFTRRHYNKKLIAFGLCCFMGIGLTSTGFAAWVMSRDAQKEAESGVNVSVMKDASVDITLWELLDNGDIATNESGNPVEMTKDGEKYKLSDNFSFDADPSDNFGRIRGTTDSVEDLKVTVKGSLGASAENVAYTLTAKLTLPTAIKNAIDKNYIALTEESKAYFSDNGGIVNVVDGAFTIVIEFNWGSAFKNVNPSIYFDTTYDDSTTETPFGTDVSDEKMEEIMNDFHSTLVNGLDVKYDTENPETAISYSGIFNLILSATPTNG